MESVTGRNQETNYNQLPSLVKDAIPFIFDDFPIYDETHRIPLETKILNHFMFREICTTPFARWKWELNGKLQEIMPYYNELYKTAALEYNPLDDVNYSRWLNQNTIGTDNYSENNDRNKTGNTTDNKTYQDKIVDTKNTKDVLDGETNTTENIDTTGTKSGNEDTTGNKTGNKDTVDTTTGNEDTTGNTKGDEHGTGNITTSSTSDTTGSLTRDEGITEHGEVSEVTNQQLNESSEHSSDTHTINAHNDTPMSTLEPLENLEYLSRADLTDQKMKEDSTHHATTDTTKNTTSDLNRDTGVSEDSSSNTTNAGNEDSKQDRNYTENQTGNRTFKQEENIHETYTDNDTGNRTYKDNETGNRKLVGKEERDDIRTIDVNDNIDKSGNSNVQGSYHETNNDTIKSDRNKTGNRQDWEHWQGKMNSRITYSEMIMEYRKAILNIDLLIINELEECFFLIL